MYSEQGGCRCVVSAQGEYKCIVSIVQGGRV